MPARKTPSKSTTATVKETPVAAGLKFDTVEMGADTRTRTAAPNPVLDAVRQTVNMMTTAPGKGLSFKVPADEVQQYVNHLRRAGKTLGVTVVIRPGVDDEGKPTGAITFRCKPLVTRKSRKA